MVAMPGQQYPSNARIHRKIPGEFAEAAAFTAPTPITAEIPIAGDNYTRIYFKASKAGTLKFEFVRPYPSSAVYDGSAVADVVTVADTEKMVDVAVKGESRLKITFTPDVDGAVTYGDVCHTWGI